MPSPAARRASDSLATKPNLFLSLKSTPSQGRSMPRPCDIAPGKVYSSSRRRAVGRAGRIWVPRSRQASAIAARRSGGAIDQHRTTATRAAGLSSPRPQLARRREKPFDSRGRDLARELAARRPLLGDQGAGLRPVRRQQRGGETARDVGDLAQAFDDERIGLEPAAHDEPVRSRREVTLAGESDQQMLAEPREIDRQRGDLFAAGSMHELEHAAKLRWIVILQPGRQAHQARLDVARHGGTLRGCARESAVPHHLCRARAAPPRGQSSPPGPPRAARRWRSRRRTAASVRPGRPRPPVHRRARPRARRASPARGSRRPGAPRNRGARFSSRTSTARSSATLTVRAPGCSRPRGQISSVPPAKSARHQVLTRITIGSFLLPGRGVRLQRRCRIGPVRRASAERAGMRGRQRERVAAGRSRICRPVENRAHRIAQPPGNRPAVPGSRGGPGTLFRDCGSIQTPLCCTR